MTNVWKYFTTSDTDGTSTSEWKNVPTAPIYTGTVTYLTGTHSGTTFIVDGYYEKPVVVKDYAGGYVLKFKDQNLRLL